MSRTLGLTVFLFSMLALAPARAHADGPLPPVSSGFYLPFGANVGAAIRGQDRSGLLLGGEVSGVRIWDDGAYSFAGGYLDYLRDFGIGVHRISLGPEVGRYFCGIDAGPVFEFGNRGSNISVRARAFGSLAFVTLYVGAWYRPSAGETNWSTEVGLLLKLPTLGYHEGHGWILAMK